MVGRHTRPNAREAIRPAGELRNLRRGPGMTCFGNETTGPMSAHPRSRCTYPGHPGPTVHGALARWVSTLPSFPTTRAAAHPPAPQGACAIPCLVYPGRDYAPTP